jgi:Domain of unknown function (DUF4340)
MKVKKEYIILAVLIVALSLYLVLHKRDRTEYKLPALQTLSTADIKKIEIAKPGEPAILLERKNDRWVISPQGYPADDGKVSVILDAIENLTLTALVSESKSYERYGLGGADKISVKAWTDKGLKRDFEVGNPASSFQHTFVKIAGYDRVFQAREDLRSRFDYTVDSLRDRVVLKFEPSQVKSIEIHDVGKTVTFVRKPVPVEVSAGKEGKTRPTGGEVVWESSEGKGDEAKLKQLLTSLSALKCKGYIYDRKKGDFKDPVYSIKVKGPEEYTLSVFAKNDKNKSDYPGVSSQSDSPFLLPEYQASRIMLSPEQMIKKSQ